jgi:hypothetical protein
MFKNLQYVILKWYGLWIQILSEKVLHRQLILQERPQRALGNKLCYTKPMKVPQQMVSSKITSKIN